MARSSSSKKNTRSPKRRGIGGVVCLFLGVFALLGYFIRGFWLLDAVNLFVFKGLFGWGFWVAPWAMFAAAWILFTHKGRPVTFRLVCALFLPLIAGALLHTINCGAEYSMQVTKAAQYYSTGINLQSGGFAGGYVSELLRQAISAYGAIFVLVFFLMFCILGAANVSAKELFAKVEPLPYKPEPVPTREKTPVFDFASVRVPGTGEAIADPVPEKEAKKRSRREEKEEEKAEERRLAEEKRAGRKKAGRKEEPAPAETVPPEAEGDIPPMPPGLETSRRLREEGGAARGAAGGSRSTTATGRKEAAENREPPRTPEERRAARKAAAETMQEIPEKASRNEVKEAAGQVAAEIVVNEAPENYVFPSLDLLHSGDGSQADDNGEKEANWRRLEDTLKSFGVGATITGAIRGPSITRYDLELEAGLRLTKLTNLADDLALALGVTGVRIAPIPGKVSTVGVEVPNRSVSTVHLHDVLASVAFRSARSALSFAVGMDIAGNSIVGNISKMPHMLIAGTTGSGKSVCMNCLILSLLYKSSPEDVRLIMIDPKMVEFGVYNGIPHLYIPVVTDPKKAAGALQWSVVEMMKRYRLFADSKAGIRDLATYNAYQKKNGGETLPNLVIVIDELADLMMTAAKEVEESICRVAQMGRAAGVHLVIATQRPSVDVITGLMKANIPSRIALSVSSSMESRIIMDQPGAEKLVGNGDMLYSPIGMSKPLRVQGAFVSDEDREQVIEFIKQGGEARYDEAAIADIEQKAAEKEKSKEKGGSKESSSRVEVGDGGDNPFADYDDMLPQAVEALFDIKQASTSMLQRKLKLGYARAARIMDQMEELGIVGPFEGSKPRQVLITREQWHEMSMSGRTDLQKLMDEQTDDFSESRGDGE